MILSEKDKLLSWSILSDVISLIWMFIVSNSCISNLKQNGTWTIEKSLPNLVVYDILFNSFIDCSGLFEGSHTYFQENWTLNLKLWPSSNMSGLPNYISNRLCMWISRVRGVLKVFDFLALGALPTMITHSDTLGFWAIF